MNTITTLLNNNEGIHDIYNIYKTNPITLRTIDIQKHYYNKKQFITSNSTNYITKGNSINNTENVLNIKKTFL